MTHLSAPVTSMLFLLSSVAVGRPPDPCITSGENPLLERSAIRPLDDRGHIGYFHLRVFGESLQAGRVDLCVAVAGKVAFRMKMDVGEWLASFVDINGSEMPSDSLVRAQADSAFVGRKFGTFRLSNSAVYPDSVAWSDADQNPYAPIAYSLRVLEYDTDHDLSPWTEPPRPAMMDLLKSPVDSSEVRRIVLRLSHDRALTFWYEVAQSGATVAWDVQRLRFLLVLTGD